MLIYLFVFFQIAEVKRLNNLIRDQDFYALTSVKIPVKQHSFLVDQIQDDDKKCGEKVLKTVGRSLSNGSACIESGDDQSIYYDSETDHAGADLSDPDTQRQVIRKISINKATRIQSSEAVKFLKDMDKDLSHILKTTRTERNSLDEVISVLTHKSVTPIVMPQRKKSKYLDFVIEWKTTVTILVLVAIIVPLAIVVYVLYYKK